MMKILTNSEIDNRPNPKVCINSQKSKPSKIFGEYESKNKQNCIKSPKYKFFQEQQKTYIQPLQNQQQKKRCSAPQHSNTILLSNTNITQQTSNKQPTQKAISQSKNQGNSYLQQVVENNAIITYYENEIQNLKQIITFYKANNKEQELKQRIKQLQKENGLIKDLALKTDKECKALKIQIQRSKINEQILLKQIKCKQDKDRENFILINNYQTTTRDYESLRQSMDLLILENQSLKKQLQQCKKEISTVSTENSRYQNELDQIIKQLELSLHLNKDQQLKLQRLHNQLHEQKQTICNLKKVNLELNKTEDRVNFDSNYLSKVIKQNKDILNKQKQIEKKNEELENNLVSSKQEVLSKAKEIQYLTKQLIKLKKCSSPTNLDRLKLQYRENKQNNSSRSPMAKENNGTIIGQKINRISMKDYKKLKI